MITRMGVGTSHTGRGDGTGGTDAQLIIVQPQVAAGLPVHAGGRPRVAGRRPLPRTTGKSP
jgi:hypothetical protein